MKPGLYLIGILTYDDGWKIIQYFCEDVSDEPTVLGNFSLQSKELVKHPTENSTVLSLTYRNTADVSVPVSLDIKLENWFMNLTGSELNLCVGLYEGELRFFYPNYCDYYYLPMEDRAIHKSLAEFVDKSHRKKATAKTCYQKVSGIFLPEPEPVFSRLSPGNIKTSYPTLSSLRIYSGMTT